MEATGRFRCQYCIRYFSQKRYLLRHINSKHGAFPEQNAVPEVELDVENNLNNVEPVVLQVEEVVCPDSDIVEFDIASSDDILEELSRTSNIRFDCNNQKNFKANNREEKYLTLMLKYLSKPEIPRKYVFELTNDFAELIGEDELGSRTECHINRQLINLGFLIKPKTVTLATQQEPYMDCHNNPKIRKISYEIKLYSVVDLFSSIFQKTNIFDIIYNYCSSLKDNDVLTDFTQSKLFKRILKAVEDYYTPNSKIFIVPLFFYIDEFEPNNPLGSRSTYKKVGGFYSKVPCMPPLLQSKMFNIYELMLFHGADRKLFGNNRLFVDIINSLNDLADTPIAVEHEKYSHVRLIPCVMNGDNLGLNQYTDRNDNFNTDYCCRICFISRSHEAYYFMCTESYLFTRRRYEVTIGDSDSAAQSESTFNNLRFYHVIDNPSIDPMHDELEGFCRYAMILILHICVKVEKYFTIEYLNQRITQVVIDESNTIPLLNKDFDAKSKGNPLRMSASEMRIFIKFFPIYVGQKIPRDSECWELFLLMRHIEAISFSKFIYKDKTADLLRTLIPLFNKLYWKLYDKYLRDKTKKMNYIKMPYKFHVLTHYPYIVENFGALDHIQCMRFEQAHQLPKKTAASTKCSKNILETMVKKINFKYSYLLMNFSEKTNIEFKLGPKEAMTTEEIFVLKNTYNFTCLNEFSLHKYLKFNELIIKNDLVIKTDGSGKECDFVVVKHILKYMDNVYFAVQKLETVCFDEFLFCFEINFLDYFELILFEDICECLNHTSFIYMIDSKPYINFNDYYYYENE